MKRPRDRAYCEDALLGGPPGSLVARPTRWMRGGDQLFNRRITASTTVIIEARIEPECVVDLGGVASHCFSVTASFVAIAALLRPSAISPGPLAAGLHDFGGSRSEQQWGHSALHEELDVLLREGEDLIGDVNESALLLTMGG